MMLEPAVKKGPAEKDLKVRLSVSLHMRLHALKILQGKPMQETVAEALEAYFASQVKR